MTPPDSWTAEAILRTLLYADVFKFPMTEAEIHHFLIGLSATPEEVHTALHNSSYLAEHLECANGYYVVCGSADSIHTRMERNAASLKLWKVARRYGKLIAHLPYVRMVAMTGALAMRNASDERDDLDYLLVTAPARAWTARALAIVLVRLAKLWGVSLCPNYVLAETALVQARQDIFVAHELAQMVPLAGYPLYESMRAVNGWAAEILPNAEGPFYVEADDAPYGLGLALQRLSERLLGGSLGDAIERWEQRRKLRKFAPQVKQPGAAAQLDDQRIKGHFNDYGAPALREYYRKLEQYNLQLQESNAP